MAAAIILGIGGAHIDRRGQVSGAFVPGASNPGAMTEEVGGGAFNALRNAMARGAVGRLMSVRGGDAAGATVALAIARAGIRDLSVTFLDRATPSYTAILSRDGDVVAALADMGLYDLAFPMQLRRSSVRAAAGEADAILCDANLPQPALARLPAVAGGTPIYAIAISPAKAVRLADILPDLAGLFLNAREAAALTGLPATAPQESLVKGLRSRGVRRAVLTRGADPVVAFDQTLVLAITPPRPRRIVDVTGAGDAIAGATVAALLAGIGFQNAVRHGMAAAMLAVESAHAAPDASRDAFEQALALVPAGEPLHDTAFAREIDVA